MNKCILFLWISLAASIQSIQAIDAGLSEPTPTLRVKRTHSEAFPDDKETESAPKRLTLIIDTTSKKNKKTELLSTETQVTTVAFSQPLFVQPNVLPVMSLNVNDVREWELNLLAESMTLNDIAASADLDVVKVHAYLRLGEMCLSNPKIFNNRDLALGYYLKADKLDQTGMASYDLFRVINGYYPEKISGLINVWEFLSKLLNQMVTKGGCLWRESNDINPTFYLFKAASMGWKPAIFGIAANLYNLAETDIDRQNSAELMFYLACQKYEIAIMAFKSLFRVKESYPYKEKLSPKLIIEKYLLMKKCIKLSVSFKELSNNPIISDFSQKLIDVAENMRHLSQIHPKYTLFEAQPENGSKITTLGGLRFLDINSILDQIVVFLGACLRDSTPKTAKNIIDLLIQRNSLTSEIKILKTNLEAFHKRAAGYHNHCFKLQYPHLFQNSIMGAFSPGVHGV